MNSAALSSRNSKVKRLRRLARSRRQRWTEGAFLVEGRLLVDEAVAARYPLEAIFCEPTAVRADDGVGGSVMVESLAGGTLERVLDTVTPQGCVAVAHMRLATLDQVVDDRTATVVVLAGVADPGNAGTLIRSAEAAGAGAVLFTDGAVDPFSPKCVRASAGSIFRIPIVNGGGAVPVLDELGQAGFRRVGSAVGGGTPYDQADLRGRLALVLGGEAHGLPPDVAASLDESVHVPMSPSVQSLNVAVAGSILLFEAARQRGACS